MEMSLQMNFKMVKKSPMLQQSRLREKPYKFNTFSCRASELAMPRKKTNFYEILSLESNNVGFDEIKKAYRSKALLCHPDVCPPSAKEEPTRRFVELQEAYETLSDPISRRIYDYELGFINSLGVVFERLYGEERNFDKAVWEKQLHELKQQSNIRMKRKKTKFMQRDEFCDC